MSRCLVLVLLGGSQGLRLQSQTEVGGQSNLTMYKSVQETVGKYLQDPGMVEAVTHTVMTEAKSVLNKLQKRLTMRDPKIASFIRQIAGDVKRIAPVRELDKAWRKKDGKKLSSLMQTYMRVLDKISVSTLVQNLQKSLRFDLAAGVPRVAIGVRLSVNAGFGPELAGIFGEVRAAHSWGVTELGRIEKTFAEQAKEIEKMEGEAAAMKFRAQSLAEKMADRPRLMAAKAAKAAEAARKGLFSGMEFTARIGYQIPEKANPLKKHKVYINMYPPTKIGVGWWYSFNPDSFKNGAWTAPSDPVAAAETKTNWLPKFWAGFYPQVAFKVNINPTSWFFVAFKFSASWTLYDFGGGSPGDFSWSWCEFNILKSGNQQVEVSWGGSVPKPGDAFVPNINGVGVEIHKISEPAAKVEEESSADVLKANIVAEGNEHLKTLDGVSSANVVLEHTDERPVEEYGQWDAINEKRVAERGHYSSM